MRITDTLLKKSMRGRRDASDFIPQVYSFRARVACLSLMGGAPRPPVSGSACERLSQLVGVRRHQLGLAHADMRQDIYRRVER